MLDEKELENFNDEDEENQENKEDLENQENEEISDEEEKELEDIEEGIVPELIDKDLSQIVKSSFLVFRAQPLISRSLVAISVPYAWEPPKVRIIIFLLRLGLVFKKLYLSDFNVSFIWFKVIIFSSLKILCKEPRILIIFFFNYNTFSA